jgi:hypothetical protein
MTVIRRAVTHVCFMECICCKRQSVYPLAEFSADFHSAFGGATADR